MKQLLLLAAATLFTLISFSQAKQPANQGKAIVIGEMAELHSTILSEKRMLNIYLPPGYSARDTATYPVVYLLDGGVDEDFLHITGLYQFNSFPWINLVSPSIIVGIVNTDRRRDMTYPTRDSSDVKRYPTAGHSERFIQFLEKELQPYIKKRWKTNGSATLVGESLAGLLATEILLKKPGLFNKYIIVSPSLWWDNGSLLDYTSDSLQNLSLPKLDVYIGVGKEGLTPGDKPRVMEVDANLLADKIRSVNNKKIKVHFDYLPLENHATIMHQAVFNAIRLIYQPN